jgi:hypothetical protein
MTASPCLEPEPAPALLIKIADKLVANTAAQHDEFARSTLAPLQNIISHMPSITSVLCIELCCGSAGLSAAIRRRGPDTIGVDRIRNPSRPQAPIVKLDLSTQGGQFIVRNMLMEANVAYIHAAVPCYAIEFQTLSYANSFRKVFQTSLLILPIQASEPPP